MTIYFFCGIFYVYFDPKYNFKNIAINVVNSFIIDLSPVISTPPKQGLFAKIDRKFQLKLYITTIIYYYDCIFN